MARLEANTDDDTLTIQVFDAEGNERDSLEADIDILRQNQRDVKAFERPIYTFLTLYDREQQTNEEVDLDEIADADLEDLPTQ